MGKGRDYAPEVVANAALYTMVVGNDKVCASSLLHPLMIPEDRRYRKCHDPLAITGATEGAILSIVLWSNCDYNFRFLVFCSEIMGRPCYHLDSGGPAHRNKVGYGIPLEGESMETPHINRFTAGGMNYAYRPDDMVSNWDQLQDPELCIGYFCNHFNIRTLAGGSPQLIAGKGALLFKATDTNPTQDVTFP